MITFFLYIHPGISGVIERGRLQSAGDARKIGGINRQNKNYKQLF